MSFSRRGGPGPCDAAPIYVMSLFVAVMNDFATALVFHLPPLYPRPMMDPARIRRVHGRRGEPRGSGDGAGASPLRIRAGGIRRDRRSVVPVRPCGHGPGFRHGELAMRASGREPWLLSGRRLDPVDADGRAVHLASPARAGLVLPAILLAALMAQLTAPPTDRPAQARPLEAMARDNRRALQLLAEAESKAIERRRYAEGDAGKFAQVAEAHRQSPEVTGYRLFITAVENSLKGKEKIVADPRVNGGEYRYWLFAPDQSPKPDRPHSRGSR